MRKFNIISILSILMLSLFACSEEGVDDNGFGTLSGKVVTNGDNTPLVNVKITSSPVSTTVFTDENGEFEIEEIEVGDYSIQAELTDFQTAFEAATIFEGNTSTIVFELDSLSVTNLSPLFPLLLFPEDGAEDILTETELVWSSSENDDDEISYEVQLRNGETNEITFYTVEQDTVLELSGLPIGKNHFWQVSASDGVNEAVVSSISSFSTKGGNSNRFLYVRNIEGNNVIFSGDEFYDSDGATETDQNELQLTIETLNSYKPIKNNTVDKIAFLRLVGAETHLFTMKSDGTDLNQITSSVPVAGFRQNELEYAWYDNGAKLYFPNFNKLYSINQDGSGLEVVYETSGEFISEIAVNPTNSIVVIKTNDINGYNARIVVIDVTSDAEQSVVAEGLSGALGGIDFSADGTRVLFTRDVSGAENTAYRQLDSRIFEYDLVLNTTEEIDTDKEPGTNDLDAKYSPDDGAIIFVNTSNDGISEQSIYKTIEEEEEDTSLRELLFTNAFMPNWE